MTDETNPDSAPPEPGPVIDLNVNGGDPIPDADTIEEGDDF